MDGLVQPTAYRNSCRLSGDANNPTECWWQGHILEHWTEGRNSIHIDGLHGIDWELQWHCMPVMLWRFHRSLMMTSQALWVISTP